MDDRLIGINGSHDFTLAEAEASRRALNTVLTAMRDTAIENDTLQPWDDIDTHGRQ